MVRKVECDEHAVIAARYANWESCARIGADYGITRQRVHQILCSLPGGVPKRSSRPFPSRETALRLVAETGSVHGAAAALGISRKSFSNRYPGLRYVLVAARNRRILEHVRGGASWAVAARREGRSWSAARARSIVERWAKRKGIALPRRRTRSQAGEAHRLREEGLSWQAVAERLGYANTDTVRNAVRHWKRRTGHA